ncbi:hypothetical protein D3C86_522050 [compost metagenome]
MVAFGVAHHVLHFVQHRLPVRRNGLHEREQIGHAHIIDRRGIQVRREGDPRQRGVTAVAGAIDADALGVGDALPHQPLHAVRDVVLHLQAPLPEAGLPEVAAVAGGSAEVHLQHAESSVGQELHLGVVAPAVACPRAAVRVHDAGQVFGVAAGGQGQVAVYGPAVAALITDGPHPRHVGFGNGRIQIGQLGQRVGGGVVDVAGTRRAVVVGGDDELVFVAVGALDDEIVSAQPGGQLLVQGLGFGIEELVLRLVGLVGGHRQHAALARERGAVQVHRVGREDFFFGVGVGRVDDHQRQLVAPAVAQRVEPLVVEGEECRADAGAVIGGDQGAEIRGFVVAVEQGGVQPVAGDGGAHLARVVGLPADDVAGILRHQHGRAGVDIDAIDVEHFGVALVVADQDVFGVVFEVVLDARAHALVGSQVGDRARLGVDGQHVVVLIAAKILLVQHDVRALPEIGADVARGFAGELAGLAHQLAALQRLDVDVHAGGVAVDAGGLHEGERLAVFRQAEIAALRIAEEVFQGIGAGRRLRGAGTQGGAYDAGGQDGARHE